MTLPVPNLDDRRFQDLVDEAKRMVQQRCPEWTDHNVSDPGVTLIETFAWMTDQLIYRLNRVPDRLYVKFLELIDVRLFPPTPARTPLTFWLAAPPETAQRVAVNSKAATIRTETEKAIVFSTVEDLDLVPCSLASIATQAAGSEERVDRTEELRRGTRFAAFSAQPKPDDALVMGLSDAVPHCAIRLRMQCMIEGVGVDPKDPPLVWEAWDGEIWHPCDVDSDATGGLNRDGDVIVHVGREHAVGVLDGKRGGWLRARLVASVEGQPSYNASPQIQGVEAATIGGTVDGVNAEIVTEEVLGISDGTSGQRFPVRRAPVLAGAGDPVLECSSDTGWTEWKEVQNFAGAGPDDPVFVLDAAAGEVELGPAVRQPDGSIRLYGRVPEKGEQLRLRSYATGGGRGGNVSRGAISVLKSSIPYVARVENRQAARGGVDGEDLENAKERGPIQLRTRARAVTAEDFEQLSREAAPEVARVRCLSAGEGLEAGSVRLLVVPEAPDERGRLRFEQLIPGEETLQAIASRLDTCRLVGTRVLVEPPLYQGVTIVARLRSRPRASVARVEAAALDALFRHLNPVTGGPDGQGWPFGRPVQSGEIFSILQSVPDVELVEDVRIFGADPTTGSRGSATQRLDVAPNSLVFSYEHQVRVEFGVTAMRALIPGLPTPHPLGPYLPALYQEDGFAQALTAGLDEVLSPLIASLDNLAAYHGPDAAPDDFLAWLGGWVGMELDDDWPEERRRALVRRAVEIYRIRGTAEGLRAHIELVTGGRAEIVESGGVAWSRESGADLPGQPEPRMTIRVYVDDVAGIDTRALDRLVGASKPAHVIHALEIATGG